MKVIKNTIKELPENYSWDDIFSTGIGVPTGTQNMFKIYFEIPKLKSQSLSTETGQQGVELSNRGKYVIIDLRNMDFMKNEKNEINYYDTREEAAIVCGMYEFENVWVCKLIYNHIEPK